MPKIKDVETYKTDIAPTYACPTSFVRYHRPTQFELKNNLEYVIDAEDEVWLLNNSKFGGSLPKSKGGIKRTSDDQEKKETTELPLAMLETMLDILEKATAFEAIIRIDQAENLILQRLPQLYHMYPIKARAGVVTLRHVLSDVYGYWVSKRSKLKRPLLRRFWPVTSSDDTNPHLVFRPREKEKYSLRRKRQNDMDAYRKLQQLRQDFQQVRLLLSFIKHREELNRSMVKLQKEWFYQKIYDAIDTSGEPRISTDLERLKLDDLLKKQKYFEQRLGQKSRSHLNRKSSFQSTSSISVGQAFGGVRDRMFSGGIGSQEAAPKIIAGQNHGEPAPNFLNPLSTRESYATSWDMAQPYVTTFVDASAEPTFRFRHRPRVGRGGRLCVDRMPLPIDPNIPPTTYFRAGNAPIITREPKQRLLELLPPALDHEILKEKVESICLTALKEDYDSFGKTGAASAAALEQDENDGDTVVVRVEDYLNSDNQMWGEERFAIGPI